MPFGHFDIAVPIGVSFFTFVQIGYLIDAYNGQLLKHDFARYIVFTAFFPCVTAGPLGHAARNDGATCRTRQSRPSMPRRVTIGLTMFAMGLFKKVVLADSIAPFADKVFGGAHGGMALDTATAWIGALCYTLQLYFDFSGYSDMAIGLATIFAIKLPLNFDSPFKATNISDFWRRWHMTMTRFFTAYVYSSLAMWGMRKGMAWRFGRVGRFMLVAACAVHRHLPCGRRLARFGLDLCDLWRHAWPRHRHLPGLARILQGYKLPSPVAWLITMVTVVCGLVMFRAPDVPTRSRHARPHVGLGQAPQQQRTCHHRQCTGHCP